MVAAVAVLGEWATTSPHLTRGHVVVYVRAVDEVLARQRHLDTWLLLDQPVERLVHLAHGDVHGAYRQRKARGRRLRSKRAVEGPSLDPGAMIRWMIMASI